MDSVKEAITATAVNKRGRLGGRGPEMRYLPNDNLVTSLIVATNCKRTGSDG